MPTETMSEKCSTCAFRKGTPANQSLSFIKARLLAHLGEEFYCHDNTVFVTKEGATVTIENKNRFDFTTVVPRGEYKTSHGLEWKLCHGWSEMAAAIKAKGMQFTGWKAELTNKMLAMIEAIEDGNISVLAEVGKFLDEIESAQ